MIPYEQTQAEAINGAIGGNIRRIRQEREMTLSTLGARLGVSRQTMHRYETAQQPISAGRLVFLSKFLKVPVSEFTEGSVTQ